MRRDNQAHARALLGAALFAATATSACTTEQRDRTTMQQAERDRIPTPTMPGQAAQPDVDRVKEQPERYYDKQVRLTGEVDQLLADRAFSLEGTGWAFNDNITVLMKNPMDPDAGGPLTDDDELIVTGTVRHFVVADIERELGWDVPSEIETKLRDRPVVVADMVRKVGMPPKKVAEAGQPAGQQQLDSVTKILGATDPRQFAGQKVDLERETVQAVVGKGLWIGPSGAQQMFVVPMTMPKDIAAGDAITASGTLREAPANAAENWDLPADAAKALGLNAVYLETVTIRKVAPDTDERRN